MQKITDTITDSNDNNAFQNVANKEMSGEFEMEFQRPHFSRPMQSSDLIENQMKRMQFTDNDRMKNQGTY